MPNNVSPTRSSPSSASSSRRSSVDMGRNTRGKSSTARATIHSRHPGLRLGKLPDPAPIPPSLLGSPLLQNPDSIFRRGLTTPLRPSEEDERWLQDTPQRRRAGGGRAHTPPNDPAHEIGADAPPAKPQHAQHAQRDALPAAGASAKDSARQRDQAITTAAVLRLATARPPALRHNPLPAACLARTPRLLHRPPATHASAIDNLPWHPRHPPPSLVHLMGRHIAYAIHQY
ncbi:hypothetical protein EV714DRAFT_214682 [Schizophyllum commune]